MHTSPLIQTASLFIASYQPSLQTDGRTDRQNYDSLQDRASIAASRGKNHFFFDEYVNEWQVFRMLDRLRPTATGFNALPAWFLKLGAPAFYKPIARLHNLSIATSTVPQQWISSVVI